MPRDADSNYSFNPWMQDVPPIESELPGYYNQDQQLRYEALVSQLSMTADEIRTIRPPVGNQPFPPRFGYPQEQPTVMDILKMSQGQDFLLQDTPTKQDSGQPGTLTPVQSPW